MFLQSDKLYPHYLEMCKEKFFNDIRKLFQLNG